MLTNSNTNDISCIEKWDETESPEILDREETSEIPSLPLGDNQNNAQMGMVIGF